ncbi:MAG: hypothetical protein U0R49_00090 [Fimbriimonadales bacterium]
MGFSVQPAISGSTYQWTFSGCGANPTTSNQAAPNVTFSIPCEATATVTVTTGEHTYEYSGKAYVIGGPIEITQENRIQTREGRIYPGSLTAWQPWILEYFNYNLKNGQPSGLQLANNLHVEAKWGQPPGTTFDWVKSGPIDFVIEPTDTSPFIDLCANASSARGGAQITLVYTLTKDGFTGSVQDSSDEYYAKTVIADSWYRKITCHKPDHVSDVGKVNLATSNGTAPNWLWAFKDAHVMELFSQLDPFSEVWVQERFPPDGTPPTRFDNGQLMAGFEWNGSDPNNIVVWTSGTTQYNVTPQFQQNYSYHARFTDKIGFEGWYSTVPRPLSGGVPVLTFTHDYFAATESFSMGGPGIFVGSFTARCYTDGTTHTGGLP